MANYKHPSNSTGGPPAKVLKKEPLLDEPDTKRGILQQSTSSSSSSKANNGGWSVASFILDGLSEIPNARVASNLVDLFAKDNTIPFIARYRRHMIQDITPDTIRKAHERFEEAKVIKHKIETIKKQLDSHNSLTKDLNAALTNSRSVEEVNVIYAPYKPTSKSGKTLAARARAAGLESVTMEIMEGRNPNLHNFIGKENLSSMKDVLSGIQHIMADVIYHNSVIRDFLTQLSKDASIKLVSTATKAAASANASNSGSNDHKKDVKKEKATTKKDVFNPRQLANLEKYFDYTCPVGRIYPHVTSAISRGESQKILTVKIVLPTYFAQRLSGEMRKRFMSSIHTQHHNLFELAMADCISRLIEPFLQRQVRARLNQAAQDEAIATFARNLKQLLLTPPLKNEVIMGIDPGYAHGCKCAVVAPDGSVLDTAIIYLPQTKYSAFQKASNPSSYTGPHKVISQLISSHSVTKIAIGNGTACRETECMVAALLQNGGGLIKGEYSGKSSSSIEPGLSYTIVGEQGSSVYSASPLAMSELPGMDEKLRSAVSIGRRLLDPLSEYLKIEPRHLGIGQYQHDMPVKSLDTALNSVVQECVSFVGVDLNTCSQTLLQHIAGLNATRAKAMLDLRASLPNGRFVNREQLKKVKGLGAKSFEQCAGFVRVYPPTKPLPSAHLTTEIKEVKPEKESKGAGKSRKRKAASTVDGEDITSAVYDPLDTTNVHPESYRVAEGLLDLIGCSKADIGKNPAKSTNSDKPGGQKPPNTASPESQTIFQRCEAVLKSGTIDPAKDFGDCGAAGLHLDSGRLKMIAEALSQPPALFDYRDLVGRNQKPQFRRSIRSLADINVGTRLRGTVRNVVGFGAFVDVGVGDDGLIPKRYLECAGGEGVGVGQGVNVEVMSLDLAAKRFALRLLADK